MAMPSKATSRQCDPDQATERPGGDYDTAGKPVASRVFMNNGAGKFQDATQRVFGKTKALARVIKVADVNGDSAPDVALGTTYDSQSHLFLGSSAGGWTDVTQKNFPAADLSAGDLEFGDVDGDKDLDIVIADWGDGSPLGRGGKVVLWLNNGAGKFTEAAPAQMPKTLVQFSWDLELLDVDNDWDLDLAVSCKTCPTSLLFINDGSGTFADASGKQMPAFPNNYEFAPIDLDGDRYLDLVTINDGPTRSAGLSEHVFRNDGTGAFVDVTDKWWPEQANPGWDDNVVVGLDVESDGDADFLVGSLDGPDRLLINDGSGGLALAQDVFDAPASARHVGPRGRRSQRRRQVGCCRGAGRSVGPREREGLLRDVGVEARHSATGGARSRCGADPAGPSA